MVNDGAPERGREPRSRTRRPNTHHNAGQGGRGRGRNTVNRPESGEDCIVTVNPKLTMRITIVDGDISEKRSPMIIGKSKLKIAPPPPTTAGAPGWNKQKNPQNLAGLFFLNFFLSPVPNSLGCLVSEVSPVQPSFARHEYLISTLTPRRSLVGIYWL